jgi:hypothetical protein
MAIKILGHPILYWLWIFAFLFLMVIAGSQIYRMIKKDFNFKEYQEQFLAYGLFALLVVILHYYYPITRFWKEFSKSLGIH